MRDPFTIISALGLPLPKGIIQVGASSGQEVDQFISLGIAHALLIEALPEPFQVLASRCAKAPGYIPANMVCTATDGERISFHVASNFGESSSILKPTRHLTDFPWVKFQDMREMVGYTLDRVVASFEANYPAPERVMDMLYMDLQGAELHVLKGANATLHKVKYIYTEVGFGGSYDGDVELVDLIQFLGLHGFRPYELEMGEAGWGNALFIKPPARSWQIPAK